MATAPLVLMNGWPGVGKDTVAEMLSLMLGPDKAELVDWSKDAGETYKPPADHPDYKKSQQELRSACFANVVESPSRRAKALIFTECHPDTPEGRSVAREFEAAAARSRRLLVPIYLDCQLEENMRRIGQIEA